MSKIEMQATVRAYEGGGPDDGEEIALKVHSAGYDHCVVLIVGEQEYCVDGEDLRLAIENCMRTGLLNGGPS